MTVFGPATNFAGRKNCAASGCIGRRQTLPIRLLLVAISSDLTQAGEANILNMFNILAGVNI